MYILTVKVVGQSCKIKSISAKYLMVP